MVRLAGLFLACTLSDTRLRIEPVVNVEEKNGEALRFFIKLPGLARADIKVAHHEAGSLHELPFGASSVCLMTTREQGMPPFTSKHGLSTRPWYRSPSALI